MILYRVILIGLAGESVIDCGLSARDAEAMRDRLNSDLARLGVSYAECRYAYRAEERRSS